MTPGTAINPTGITYAFDLALDIAITPSSLTAVLNAGTSVVLQASNDITVGSAITVSSATPGNLSLEAGRSILINANINTDGGNLTLIANDSVADGVVNSDRQSGNAAITSIGRRRHSGAGRRHFVGRLAHQHRQDKQRRRCGDCLGRHR